MAIVTSDFLAALYTSYKAIFVNEFAAAEGAVDYKKISTLFPSNTLIESYSWLGTVPAMREWVDERVPKGLLASDFSIKNKHYEASIAVDRDTLEEFEECRKLGLEFVVEPLGDIIDIERTLELAGDARDRNGAFRVEFG